MIVTIKGQVLEIKVKEDKKATDVTLYQPGERYNPVVIIAEGLPIPKVGISVFSAITSDFGVIIPGLGVFPGGMKFVLMFLPKVLIHLLDDNSDAARMVREIKELTRTDTEVAEPGKVIDLEMFPF